MSKQRLIIALAALLETHPCETEQIATHGHTITTILADIDFTPADSLAAAEAIADSLGIAEEEEEAEPCPAIVDASAHALMVYGESLYCQRPALPHILKETPLMALKEQSDFFA